MKNKREMFGEINYILRSIFLLLIIFMKDNRVYCDEDASPYIKIPSGELQGVYLKTPDGVKYEAYLGVRYAKPPFGELRFKNAQPASPWIGKYNASTYGSDCLQFSHFGYSILGSEDCLFVNIYKPLGKSNRDGSLFDVIIHLHGGAFMFYSPQGFKPDKFINENVVYASVNYRLGPLGFLSTGDKVLPGNLGLKDQVLAIKWIRENIKYFGGDADKITLTGVSAGGVSVHFHYLSPLSRGLFNKGISNSGAGLNPWALAENMPEKTRIVAASLGCPTSDSATMIECLSERPAHQIVAQVPMFLGWLFNPFTPFGPVVEPEDAASPFLPRHPYDIIKDGDFQQAPWLCSFTSEEGLYPAAEFADNKELLKELEANWYEYAPHALDYNFTVSSPQIRDKITEKITKHYLENKKITEASPQLVQMIGDRIFGAGIVLSALMQGAVSKAPVYLYHFSYRGKYSVSELFSHSNTNLGVCHADDSGYIYEAAVYNMDQTEADRKMGKRMRNQFISFIKTGVPEFFDGEPLPTVKEALPQIRYYEILSPDKAIVETKNDLAEFNFWSKLPLQEHLSLPDHFKDEF